MNLTLRQSESLPAAYPAVEGVTGDMLATTWQRVEHYIKLRFSEREVEWLVQADSNHLWFPPIGRVISMEGEIVDGEVAFSPTQCGDAWRLPNGLVLLSATVGVGPVPAAVSTAIQRLAEYYDADVPVPAGVRTHSMRVGEMTESMTVVASRYARAMQESGAADLLRPFRSPSAWLS